MHTPSSLAELLNRAPDERQPVMRGAFDGDVMPTVDLSMSDTVWAEAQPNLKSSRDAVERQVLLATRDLALGTEALINPLRAGRTDTAPTWSPPTAWVKPSPARYACRWCRRSWRFDGPSDVAEDIFGSILDTGGRVRASANWARQSTVSGIIFGDEGMHDLLSLSLAEFRALLRAAYQYIDAACVAFPHVRYFMVFINGGPRSAASVTHAHAQVVGRADRHFAYAEGIAANAPRDYWRVVQAVHADLGLAVDFAGGTAWANLVPVKERDITAVSASLGEGAEMMHGILQTLQRHGTNSYSLAAILSPRSTDPDPVPARFSDWPSVVWRLLDRGDANARHADMGCLELFGSSVVATDPFEVARWLREGAAHAAINQQEKCDARHLP